MTWSALNFKLVFSTLCKKTNLEVKGDLFCTGKTDEN